MIVQFLIAGLGLIILLIAGDLLVRGAVNLSLRAGIPALIVSLTVVAFGTSAPELLIAVNAVLEDAPGLALGNVVGSNTANVLMVLGIPAIIAGLQTGESDARRDFLIMLGATTLFIGFCFGGTLMRWHGIILLTILTAYLGSAFLTAKRHSRDATADADEEEDVEGADPKLPYWKIALFLVLGLAGLPLGADLLVDSSMQIASAYEVSEEIIGLTLVAIGTSLPELATTVMAAIHRQADVALGNVIGSNMFNLLGIMGVASLVGEIPVAPNILQSDLWIMLAASLALIPFVFLRWNINRVWGVILTSLYAAYMAVLLF